MLFKSMFTKENGVNLTQRRRMSRRCSRSSTSSSRSRSSGPLARRSTQGQEQFDYWGAEAASTRRGSCSTCRRADEYDYGSTSPRTSSRAGGDCGRVHVRPDAQYRPSWCRRPTRQIRLAQQKLIGEQAVLLHGRDGHGRGIACRTSKSLEPLKEDGGLGWCPCRSASQRRRQPGHAAHDPGKLEKKRKTLLGAPAGRKVVIFVDDINMPLVEEYGRHRAATKFLDFKGFYDRDKLFWKDIVDTLLFTGASGGSGPR